LEQRNDLELKESIPAKELFKQLLKSVVETWMPYIFFRDRANEYNPNKHAWNIYSSQLCTEIIQNTKEPKFIEENDKNWKTAIIYEEWELVTCNLASINVAKVNPELLDEKEIEKIHMTTMKLLDNVITLNYYPVLESKLTAIKYRSVWLWYMWLAEYFANIAKVRYDTKEAAELTDKLFEKYAYYTYNASNILAIERWKYKLFDWSERSKWIILWKNIK